MNDEFVEMWKSFIGDEDRVTNDPMEATYIGFKLWAQAVEAAGSETFAEWRPEIYGMSVPNLTGGMATMLPNHHLTKPVLIGEIQDDGQFDIVSQTAEVPGDAWTDFLAASATRMSDWADPEVDCGNYDTETGECFGQNY